MNIRKTLFGQGPTPANGHRGSVVAAGGKRAGERRASTGGQNAPKTGNNAQNDSNATQHSEAFLQQRMASLLEYIHYFCPALAHDRHSVHRVERLLLYPRMFVEENEQSQRSHAAFEHLERLLQVASIDHYEWIEFSARRHDGEPGKLSEAQFIVEVDRLCQDLHQNKLPAEDIALLFQTITSSSHSSVQGHSKSKSMSKSMSKTQSQSQSESHTHEKKEPSIANENLPVVGEEGEAEKATAKEEEEEALFVDHCNLDVAYKKYQAHIAYIKRMNSTYSQLLEVSAYMRLNKVRLHEDERAFVSSPQLEQLLASLLNKYDTFVAQRGTLDFHLLPPINLEQIENAESNIVFYEQPRSVAKQNHSKNNSKLGSIRNAITNLASSLRTTSTRIHPTGSPSKPVNNMEIPTSSPMELATAATVAEEQTQSSTQMETGANAVATENQGQITSEVNDDSGIKNDVAQPVLKKKPNLEKQFSIDSDFISHMDSTEKQQFEKFVHNMVEGDKKRVPSKKNMTRGDSTKNLPVEQRYHPIKLNSDMSIADVKSYSSSVSHSASVDSDAVKEKPGWIVLEWSGKFTGLSGKYLSRNQMSMQSIKESNENEGNEHVQSTKQNSENQSVIQKFNGRVARARALFSRNNV